MTYRCFIVCGVLGLCAPAACAARAADESLTVQRIADASIALKGKPGHVHPAVCITKSGLVLVAHYAEAAGQIHLLRSTDGGRSWNAFGQVPDIGGGHPYPGALTTLRDGRILLTWNSWVDWADLDKGRRPYFATSIDEGKTWSAPAKLPIEDGRGVYVRHRIWERSGQEWIFPMGDRVITYNPGTNQVVKTFDDAEVCYGPLVQTKAGALLHAAGYRSLDGGKSWMRVKPFPAAASYRADLLALENGWIVAATPKADQALLLQVSYDDGVTWNLLREWEFYKPGHGIGAGCPQLVQLDAEHLGVVFYDAYRAQPGGVGVYFARLRLDELKRRTAPEKK